MKTIVYKNGNAVVHIAKSDEQVSLDAFKCDILGVKTDNLGHDFGLGRKFNIKDLFNFCFNHEITDENLFERFPDLNFGFFMVKNKSYEHLEGWKFKIGGETTSFTSLLEKVELLKTIFDNSKMTSKKVYQVVSSLIYDNFICNAININDKGEPSGVMFSTFDVGQTVNGHEISSLFNTYKKYVEGSLSKFIVSVYKKSENWSCTDTAVFYKEFVEEVVNFLDLEDIVEKPDRSFYDAVRNRIPEDELLKMTKYL